MLRRLVWPGWPARARQRMPARLAGPCLLLVLLATGCGPSSVTPLAPPTLRPLMPAATRDVSTPTPLATGTQLGSALIRPTRTPRSLIIPTLVPVSPTPTVEGVMYITMADYYFDPQNVTVTVGTTVIWHHVGAVYHTIVPLKPTDYFPPMAILDRGSPDAVWTFKEPGFYEYHCDYHPGVMGATVTVVDPGG